MEILRSNLEYTKQLLTQRTELRMFFNVNC
jgi:hypothetical protein